MRPVVNGCGVQERGLIVGLKTAIDPLSRQHGSVVTSRHVNARYGRKRPKDRRPARRHRTRRDPSNDRYSVSEADAKSDEQLQCLPDAVHTSKRPTALIRYCNETQGGERTLHDRLRTIATILKHGEC